MIANAQKPVKILGKEKLEVKVTFDKAIKLNESVAGQLK
jgi:hypothetical protein